MLGLCETCGLGPECRCDTNVRTSFSRAAEPKDKPTKGPYTIRLEQMAANYRWKAENIVRFFENLGMTTEQKVDYLAKELATVHLFGRD